MVPVVFNTAAIASAKQLKDGWEYASYTWKPYTPEPKPKLIGKVIIKSDNVTVSHTLDSKGYEILFRDVMDINDLIEDLTKLRKSFLEKGE